MNPTKNRNGPDPYYERIVNRKLRIIKHQLPARGIGILTNCADNRQMELITSPSRAVRMNDVHELVCTTESSALGDTVNKVCYLAFIVFDESGVVAVDDFLFVDGKQFGKVIGFNETHAPNHMNIVIQVEELITGLEAGWQPGIHLAFKHEYV